MKAKNNPKKPNISIILPCRNEEKSLDFCLKEIKKIVKDNKIRAEIIVSDSSSDNSPKIAKKHKVILLKHDQEGYGAAYLKAFKIAKGKYIFMADADCTYDFKEIPNFLDYFEKGYDFVIGNRFKGKIEKGAMPWLHQYIGNPLFSFLFRLFFGIKIKDPHCGMRAIKKNILLKLNLKTKGMEFALEMIIKAAKNNLKIKELPINYYKRRGRSKLRSFSDGWRHLRFLLLYTPLFLFFIPGIILFALGLTAFVLLYLKPQEILGLKFYIHPMFLASLFIIVGYQLIFFSIFAKTYLMTELNEENRFLSKIYSFLTIEKGLLAGLVVSFFGILVFFFILSKWLKTGFGQLNEIKNSILGLTLIIIGIQTMFSTFMLSILGIKTKE